MKNFLFNRSGNKIIILCGIESHRIHHHNIPSENIMVIFISPVYAGRICSFIENIVLNGSVIPFAKFHTNSYTKIVIYFIIGGSIIKINPPPTVICKPVIPDMRGKVCILKYISRFMRYTFSMRLLPAPVRFAAPGIKRPMIPGFPYRVMYIIVLDNMPSMPTAFP